MRVRSLLALALIAAAIPVAASAGRSAPGLPGASAGRSAAGLPGASAGRSAAGLPGASAGRSAPDNLARARGEAARLLSLIALPPGATASASEPRGDHGVLRFPGYDEATPNLVDAHAWWTVPGRASDVLGYVGTHLPPGAKRYTSGSGNTAPGYADERWALPLIPGVLSERVLSVTVVQLDGRTAGVRTDGEAVWIVPRPAWERIPAATRSVVFTAHGRSRAGLAGTHTLTGAAARRLVTFVNRLGVVQPGSRSCPAEFFSYVGLKLLSAGGRTLASAVEYPTGCPYVKLTVGGRHGPALDDYPSVSDELARLLAGH